MISFYALWSGERIRKIFIDLKNDIVPSAMLMSKMKSETFKISHLLMDYVIHGDDENKRAVEISLNELKKYGEEHLKYESGVCQKRCRLKE
jgi:lipid II:glycine glycyltransferase (peptidoglycan interpeptide bridge formation enzyme)